MDLSLKRTTNYLNNKQNPVLSGIYGQNNIMKRCEDMQAKVLSPEEVMNLISNKTVMVVSRWVDTDMFLRDGHEYRIVERDGHQSLQKQIITLRYISL